MTKIVIEKDHFLQVIPVILDPATTEEHRQAWVNFFSHDVPDLGCAHEIQRRIPGLFPATVSFAENQEELRRQVVDADGVIIENLRIDEPELTTAPHLSFVQRFGTSILNINVSACVRHNVTVEVIRRRVNIAVASKPSCS